MKTELVFKRNAYGNLEAETGAGSLIRVKCDYSGCDAYILEPDFIPWSRMTFEPWKDVNFHGETVQEQIKAGYGSETSAIIAFVDKLNTIYNMKINWQIEEASQSPLPSNVKAP